MAESTRKATAKARPSVRAVVPAPSRPAPLTVSRPELLINGSDRHFRRLVHGLFGFLARHEAVRSGHGARIGLVGIEYTVLISIRHLAVENPDVSVSRVAEHLYLSGAFVTSVTNKLLKRGLIHKRPDPNDRRRVRLEVSEQGNALLAELAPVQRQVNDVQFGCLSTAEFLHLLDMIERLIDCGDNAIRLQDYFGQRPAAEITPPVELDAAPDRKRGRSRPAKLGRGR
ncbi:MAG: winged helix-turn-helix transcriptional regulator [Xanthobacteraceae bacterium]|nr:winged helix-turn-helix transcriptional regulator [Xanthobacteraceae bacterium]MBV9632886.1 winged helix-turn-helix transcriptional regulator [Xanthobacteraceae bacterium]